MKFLIFGIFCSLLTSGLVAQSLLLPKKANLVSDSGDVATLEFTKFEMEKVTMCPGGNNFVYGNEYQYRSLFRVEFQGDTYQLYNYPCVNNPVNAFYMLNGVITGGVFWFVQAQGREILSINTVYGSDKTIESLVLFHEGQTYKYELNRTGTLNEWSEP
jgi:hypothetical protein